MSDPMTPRTAAGQRLLDELAESPLPGARYAHHVVGLRLAAIEAEAVASWLASPEAEEALARALHGAMPAYFGEHSTDTPRDGQPPACEAVASTLLAALRGESDG